VKFTDDYQLPYPATRREAANPALGSELLARAADRELTTLDTAWAAELQKPTAILVPTSNVTSMPYDTDNAIFMSGSIQKSVGGTFSTQVPKPSTPPVISGWYHVMMASEFEAEGTINSGSYRRMWVDIGDVDPVNGYVVRERYYAQDSQTAGGQANLALEFVTFLTSAMVMRVFFRHGNTSSTVKMNITRTMWTLTRIAGDV
jgi:hypothetical protein